MSKGYYTHIRVTDFGPYVTKLILPVPSPVKEVCPGDFSVYVERMDAKGELLLLPKSWMAVDDREPSCGYIPVTGAYPSDKSGAPGDGFITLELAYGPMHQLASCISAPDGLNVFVNMRFTVTQTGPIAAAGGPLTGLTYDYPLGSSCPDAAGWINDASRTAEPLGYGYYVPQTVRPGPRPLIVWLHGAGEGGTDPSVAYMGNKVVALSSPGVQELFGGAYVLTPQTPTFWMNDGSGEYGRSGRSMYSGALMDCIEDFVSRNGNIDRDRIYIGGDSNGGFMTMRTLIDHPDYFAAAFPVCEALYDETITDEDISAIKDKPIWFTHAKNDPVVKPSETVEPTYKRLIAAGAGNVHFTFWDSITDIHEGFVDKDGKPFEYIGHFAWIPMLNDDCELDYDGSPVTIDGRKTTLLRWLARQKR